MGPDANQNPLERFILDVAKKIANYLRSYESPVKVYGVDSQSQPYSTRLSIVLEAALNKNGSERDVYTCSFEDGKFDPETCRGRSVVLVSKEQNRPVEDYIKEELDKLNGDLAGALYVTAVPKSNIDYIYGDNDVSDETELTICGSREE